MDRLATDGLILDGAGNGKKKVTLMTLAFFWAPVGLNHQLGPLLERVMEMKLTMSLMPVAEFEAVEPRLLGVKPFDGAAKIVIVDEAHGVKGPAFAVGAQAVDRDSSSSKAD